MPAGVSSNSKTPMTQDAAARIQSATARSGNGGVPKGSFAARAQAAAAKTQQAMNANQAASGAAPVKGQSSGKAAK
ncbi:MAG: hypothetical protein HC848_06710 [Limnobacter sp.]|nr:hypothetical protein [Limnobacter sp.]